MALMKPKSAGLSEGMSQPNVAGALKLSDPYGNFTNYDEESVAHFGPALPAPDMHAGRYRICLNCALPLNTFAQSREAECSCTQYEEYEDDWLEFESLEIIFVLSLVATCIATCFWFWF